MTAVPERDSAPGDAGDQHTPRLTIGEVLAVLRDDFPDVTISKIRYLESEDLVHPERTASGYRKFSRADVSRLRYVLAAQRDHYLPLRVIKQHLEAIGRGLAPPQGPGGSPQAPQEPPSPVDIEPHDVAPVRSGQLRMSAAELLADSGLTTDQLDELVGFGLIRTVPGTEYFDADALSVARTSASLAGYGLQPRHLRAFKTAADREVGLVEQIVTPLVRQRDPDAGARADSVRAEVGALAVRLHVALVRAGLRTTR